MEHSQQLTNLKKSHPKSRNIRKPRRRGKEPREPAGANSYIPPRRLRQPQANRCQPQSSKPSEFDNWQSLCKQWLEVDSSQIPGYIMSECRQFPALNSIDQLFSLTSSTILDHNADPQHLLRYSKIYSLLNRPLSQALLLDIGKDRGILSLENKQVGRSSCVGWIQLSDSEQDFVKKRSIFMEKLKLNESKYDSSLGRMSYISKELAFCYRTYLQSQSQLESFLKGVGSKVADYFPQISDLRDTRERLTKLLIGKNLKHTFNSLGLDRLNYFKLREYIEVDRVHEFNNVTSLEEYSSFIEKRKPKRGRRLALATACSVCLSDYHEMSNPLTSCSSCILRTHKLCYSFAHARCGSCTFQKLQRRVKERIGWCFICKTSGLMVVKLGEQIYAHGFCLLVHGYWQCRKDVTVQERQFSTGLGCQSSLKGNTDQRYSPLIEFYTPKGIITTGKQNQLKNIIKNDHQRFPRVNLEIHDQQLVESSPLLQSQSNSSNMALQWNQEVYSLHNQVNQNIQQGCKCCGGSFFQNCFVTCYCCGQEYHVLCAFLAGFQLEMKQDAFEGGQESLPRLNCCFQDASLVGWNRRFKLNYQRCVFQKLPQVERGLNLQQPFQAH